ncbi:MAG TPA: prepilin-type N-terminal cleavage/methylation domain-containing protein [Oculatellaceae cyanobacterium]|jgi:prepilin-type N-terminal cleavage/methylation domain-containing protein
MKVSQKYFLIQTFLVPNNTRGFTLLELLIVLTLIGIMAAIAVPSFMAMYNNSKISDAVEEAHGALQEAQREAMRKSQTCSVKLVKIGQKINPTDTTTVTSPVLRGNPESCLITGDRTLKGLVLNHSVSNHNDSNETPWEITFDYKGRTNAVTNAGTVFFSIPNTPSQEKCITTSQGIGLFRRGKRDGNSCETTQLE